MDSNKSLPSLNSSLNGGYGIRILTEEEIPVWLPAIAPRYLTAQGAPLSVVPRFIEEHRHSEIVILTDGYTGNAEGVILFNLINIRASAWVHIAFWGLTHAQRIHAGRLVGELFFDAYPEVLRIEAFISLPNKHVAAFAQEVGMEYICRVPYGEWCGEKPRDYLYYILRRPTLG